MKRVALLLTILAPLFVQPASAWQKCQYFSDGREPRCHVVSDGKGQPYVDDRRRRSAMYERYRERAARARAGRVQQGAQHTQDMRTGGTPSSVGVISPFVPGSDQDRGWQLERKRRGLCGTDQRCLNAR